MGNTLVITVRNLHECLFQKTLRTMGWLSPEPLTLLRGIATEQWLIQGQNGTS